jgi:ribosomal protein S18 acetylase RimI-like enzyme
MYKKFGYVVYRQVMGYYSGEEDAYGMYSPSICS